VSKSWDANRKTGRWDPQHLSNEEEKRIQRGIDDCMRAVIADAKYNPNALDGPISKVVPQGAAPVKDLPEMPIVPGVPATPRGERVDFTPGEPEPFVPWKPMHPTHDFIRLGTNVPGEHGEEETEK
jgi:hypothetical protein